MNVFLRAFEHWLPLAAEDLETSRDGRSRGRADRRRVPPTRWAGAACQQQRGQCSPSHGWRNGHGPDKALGGGDSAACTLLVLDAEPQAFPHGGGFRIPRGDQGGSGGEQGVRGPWAGPEAGRGSGWWGSVGHSLRNTESRLGEGFEAARWPWAVSKRRVYPVIRTHSKVYGGGLGPQPGAANDLRWGLSGSSWSLNHWPQATLSQASGPPPWDGSVLWPSDSSSFQGDLWGVIRGHFIWTEGCGMQERGRRACEL